MMHYIGSKEKLLPFLHEHIAQHVPDLQIKHFCDLFAGSGSVGRYFKSFTCKVISNDAEYYSYIINRAYLNTPDLENYDEQLQQLNALAPVEGFISKHYAPSGSRHYFSTQNAKKIDAIRSEIEHWYASLRIDEARYVLLLSTLLHAVTEVANTTSVFSAYLKTFKKSATAPLSLRALDITCSERVHEVYCENALTLISRLEGDILYLDPPYNLRQYGANYHLLNTIARYTPFTPKGKTGLPEYYSSPFSKRKDAQQALQKLMTQARFETIFLSYNSEGILSFEQIEAIMRPLGSYHRESMQHKRYNAKNSTYDGFKTTEFLHILKK